MMSKGIAHPAVSGTLDWVAWSHFGTPNESASLVSAGVCIWASLMACRLAAALMPLDVLLFIRLQVHSVNGLRDSNCRHSTTPLSLHPHLRVLLDRALPHYNLVFVPKFGASTDVKPPKPPQQQVCSCPFQCCSTQNQQTPANQSASESSNEPLVMVDSMPQLSPEPQKHHMSATTLG